MLAAAMTPTDHNREHSCALSQFSFYRFIYFSFYFKVYVYVCG